MILFIYLVKILIIIVPLLISVAYFTLAERKLLGSIQRRRGPNVIGFFGLFQPLSDGLKLFVKESFFPSSGDRLFFLLSPLLTFIVSLLGYAIIPYDEFSVFIELDTGFFYLFTISSLGVYGVILSGWSSNSKYAFLGALRSTAQMISYEVSIGFILLSCILCCGSLDLQVVTNSQKEIWFCIPFFPLFFMFFISALAETNRHPFDLPEAEAELVSGYNVEYSAMGFALFSLGEYANMLMMSTINTILFFGGWLTPSSLFYFIPGFFWFGLKISFFVVLFVWMRAALPRYRYDQLMSLGWKIFLPISLSYLIMIACILITLNSLPY